MNEEYSRTILSGAIMYDTPVEGKYTRSEVGESELSTFLLSFDDD